MANFNKKISDTSLRLGPVSFNYVSVFKPTINEDGSEGKYQVQIRIDKSDKAAKKMIDDAVEAAKATGKTSKFGGKIPARLQLPIHDGDEEHPDDDSYAGKWYFNCSSKRKPGVKILDDGVISDAMGDDDFYSGCIGAVTVNFYPYSVSGNSGIAAGLNNVIKTEDGERVSGGRSADSDFADLGEDPLG